ncbi:MAG TPA: DUF1269 domain-containing protein [Solirubrobacteraceae bacterium]|nr:DUF1269 domain-containing protein [Solirubrobacteraceae bacterium]
MPTEFALVAFDGVNTAEGAFGGHYLDIDESLHMSEPGAAKGLRAGALIGFLLGPPGFAVESVLGTRAGSQKGEPSEVEPEPTALADQSSTALPSPGSGVVLVAGTDTVEQMLQAFEPGYAHVTRRTLSEEELASLEASLNEAPLASPPSDRAADTSLGTTPR